MNKLLVALLALSFSCFGGGNLSPSGDITAVHAGDGLSGGGIIGAVTLDIDDAYVQRRVSDSCPAGSSIRAIAADGTVTCEADDGATGTGTANTIAKWTGPGSLGDSLISDNGSSVTVGTSAGQTHTLSGRLVGASSAVQALVLTHTPSNSTANTAAASVTANGTYDTTAGELTVTGVDISQGATRGAGGNALNSRGLRVHAFGGQRNAAIHTMGGDNYLNTSSGSMGIGYALWALLPAKLSVDGTFNATGAITEGSDRVISLAGTGLTKSGRTLSIDEAYVQRRVSDSCPAGSSIRAIAADGTVTCEADDGTAKITTVSGGNGTANNVDCGAGTTVCRLNYGTLTATGFVAGTDGQVLDVVYVGTTSVTIQHENTGSSTANRLILPGAQSWTFATGGGWRMVYDGTSSRWRVIGPTDRLPSATVAGPVSVGTSLTVGGAATFSHSLDVMNATTLFSSLDVYNATSLRGGATIGTHLHTNASDASPTVIGCGTTPALVGKDIAWTVTTGSGATGCTIEFAATWPSAPTCVVSSINGKGVSYVVDQFKVTISGTGASETYHAVCVGH